MITALFLRACLDLAIPATCIPVFIVDSETAPELTQLSCPKLGLNTARLFMERHPVYRNRQWHFGGYDCRTASEDKAERGA